MSIHSARQELRISVNAHAGPSNFTACKQPTANAAWRVHNGGTALHGGLPPGYQTWSLSARATVSSFAGRAIPSAGSPGFHDPSHWSDPDAGQSVLGLKKPAAPPALRSSSRPAAASERQSDQDAAAIAAAYRLLQDGLESTDGEKNSACVSEDDHDDGSSSSASSGILQEIAECDFPLPNDSLGLLLVSRDAPLVAAASRPLAPEAPVASSSGTAFRNAPRQRWMSVAPQATGASLKSLPLMKDSLMLGTNEPAVVSDSNIQLPKRAMPQLPMSHPEKAAALAPAGIVSLQDTNIPRHERASAVTQPQLRLRRVERLPESFSPSCSGTDWASCSSTEQPSKEEPLSFSGWLSVLAAIFAGLGGHRGSIHILELPDGSTVEQDAKLEFT